MGQSLQVLVIPMLLGTTLLGQVGAEDQSRHLHQRTKRDYNDTKARAQAVGHPCQGCASLMALVELCASNDHHLSEPLVRCPQ